MEESTVRRMATVEVIRYAITELSSMIDKQVELTGLEIREGVSNVLNGMRILLVGMTGLVLMLIALGVAGLMAFSLFSARVAFFLMGKGYQLVKALEGRVQNQRQAEYGADGASSEDSLAA